MTSFLRNSSERRTKDANASEGHSPIRKVYSSYSAIGVDLNSQGLNVVRAIRPTREVRQVELDLIPPLVQAHWHRANERLHSGRRLVIRRSESPLHALVVEDLHLEREILLQIFDDHHEEGQLDAQGLLGIGRTHDVTRRDIRSHYLQHGALDVLVGYPLDVSILHCRIPNLQRLRPDGIQDGQEAALEGISKH